MLSSINLIVLQIIFLYYISNSNVTAVDDNSTKSLESAASFGNWVRDKTGDEQTVITDVSGSNVEDVDRNVDHDEGSFKFPLPTTEVSDHAKSTDIFSQWFAFPKSDMIESSNPIEDVNKWKRDGHSTSNESDSETFELDSINASITQTNQDDRPSNQNELLSSESESDLIEIDHRKSNFPKNVKKPFDVLERGSTSKALRTEEIEEENVHTKEAEGDWETSDKSKKVNQGAPITKKNEAGEQKVASSSHISDKNIPHQHSQARLRGAQPDIVGDKGWSCKPKTVKSNKKKERKQHDNTKQKTEGTMKDLIDQDKPKSKSKLWRRFSLLGCN